MTNEDLEAYLRGLRWNVEQLEGNDYQPYIVIRSYEIPTGRLAGTICDIAIQRTTSIPYVLPAAIHTHPPLVEMDIGRYNTQPSAIGPDWQYWSRRRDGSISPQLVVAHIASNLRDLRDG